MYYLCLLSVPQFSLGSDVGATIHYDSLWISRCNQDAVGDIFSTTVNRR